MLETYQIQHNDIDRYPNCAGFKEHTTSREAAEYMESSGKASVMRQKCLSTLLVHPMTPKELAMHLDAPLDSVRPRCTELKEQGKIRRIGRRDRQHILEGVRDEH